jgi:hypothetical protein
VASLCRESLAPGLLLVAAFGRGALFFYSRRLPLVTGDDVDFVALDLACQLDRGAFRFYAAAQGSGHLLRVILIEAQFSSNLAVREIETHEIQAQDPNS